MGSFAPRYRAKPWEPIGKGGPDARMETRKEDMTAGSFLDVLEEIITTVVEPAAADVDANGTFPRAAVSALGEEGLLGLISSTDVGGMGLGLAEGGAGRAPAGRRRAEARRWSPACTTRAVAVIEAHGPERRAPGDRRRRAPVDAGLLRDRLAQPVLGAARHRCSTGTTRRARRQQELGDVGRRGRLLRVDEPARPTAPKVRRCGSCRPTRPG